MSKNILGIHHITAIAGDPQQNVNFYAGLLGLRLVKVTVNYDDPYTYHLYYGDGQGTPGTVLTFFPWPGAYRGRHGNGQVTATAFVIPSGALPYWNERLAKNDVTCDKPSDRFGQPVLSFVDYDGMAIELHESVDSNPERAWQGGPIPAKYAICGFHSATLSEEGYERTAKLLTDTLGFRPIGQERNRFRYEIAGGGPSTVVDLVCSPDAPQGRVAVGAVHHIAWRTPDDDEQVSWLGEIGRLGYNVSPVMDRRYFHSIYFREPGGVLFEIATDLPGFTVDEPVEILGTKLALPEWLEPNRSLIEKHLPPLRFSPNPQEGSL
jgi:catechol 2,3-dioxygenase-like lactoylglutathione lyase family enzyme